MLLFVLAHRLLLEQSADLGASSRHSHLHLTPGQSLVTQVQRAVLKLLTGAEHGHGRAENRTRTKKWMHFFFLGGGEKRSNLPPSALFLDGWTPASFNFGQPKCASSSST